MNDDIENEFKGVKVFGKIIEVMRAVDHIEKDGYNSYQDFHFASIDSIMKTMQKQFVENNLIVLPDILDEKIDGNLATVTMLVTFIDGDNPDDRFTTRWVGTGTDNSDKAINKAITAAYKQMLLKTFCIGTGEVDPDSQSEERTVQKLSDNQIADLYALLEEKELKPTAILETLGVPSLLDVPAHRYKWIIRSIENAKPPAKK